MKTIIVCVSIVLGLASVVLAEDKPSTSTKELAFQSKSTPTYPTPLLGTLETSSMIILTKEQIAKRVKDGSIREFTVVSINGRLFIYNAIENNVIEVLTSVEHKTPVVFRGCVDSSRCKSVGHSLYE